MDLNVPAPAPAPLSPVPLPNKLGRRRRIPIPGQPRLVAQLDVMGWSVPEIADYLHLKPPAVREIQQRAEYGQWCQQGAETIRRRLGDSLADSMRVLAPKAVKALDYTLEKPEGEIGLKDRQVMVNAARVTLDHHPEILEARMKRDHEPKVVINLGADVVQALRSAVDEAGPVVLPGLPIGLAQAVEEAEE